MSFPFFRDMYSSLFNHRFRLDQGKITQNDLSELNYLQVGRFYLDREVK